jgi:hypothetical protein
MTEQAMSQVAQEVELRPIIADVFATLVGGNVEFDLEWRRENDPNGKKGPIDVPNGESDTRIHFHLRDSTGLNLNFVATKEDAMWVSLVGCPPQQAGNGGQISYDSVSNQLLKVRDANSGDPCTLYYMLRFTGDPAGNGPVFEYDPTIRNGGGGGT